MKADLESGGKITIATYARLVPCGTRCSEFSKLRLHFEKFRFLIISNLHSANLQLSQLHIACFIPISKFQSVDFPILRVVSRAHDETDGTPEFKEFAPLRLIQSRRRRRRLDGEEECCTLGASVYFFV